MSLIDEYLKQSDYTHVQYNISSHAETRASHLTAIAITLAADRLAQSIEYFADKLVSEMYTARIEKD